MEKGKSLGAGTERLVEARQGFVQGMRRGVPTKRSDGTLESAKIVEHLDSAFEFEADAVFGGDVLGTAERFTV